MGGQWQSDGTFKHEIPNARIYYAASQQDGKFLLLRGKAGWGEFFSSIEDITSHLRDIKKEYEPAYWSPGYQTWTCPGDHLFEQVGKEGEDWIKVETLIFLNGIKI